MAVYTFAYSPIPIPPSAPFPQGQTAYRPLMVAQLTTPAGGGMSCLACLDSGADHCVFPLTFASALGLDPLQMKMQMTGGVGNQANPTYYADIHVRIAIGDANNNVVATIEFDTLAGFTAGVDALGMALLGQLGFFEHYGVGFNHAAKTFSVEVP